MVWMKKWFGILEEKWLGISAVLAGVIFLLTGIGMMFILTVAGDMATGITASAGRAAELTFISSSLALGWLFTVLQLVAGITWLIIGVAQLTKKG
jgi:hypothetical protein